jgi:hypothetical protein
MNDIVLYSTKCPKCLVLERKMRQQGISFVENNSVQDMLALGFKQAPILSVDGELMGFKEANDWINGFAAKEGDAE